MPSSKNEKSPARIGRCWIERDGKLYHPRLERERLKQEAWKAQQSAKGARAEAARWDAPRMPDACTTDASGIRDGMPGDASSSSSSSSSASASAEDCTERALSLVTSPRAIDFELSPGQLQAAVPGLVGAWNNIAAEHPPFVAVTVRSVALGVSPSRVNQLRHAGLRQLREVIGAGGGAGYQLGSTRGGPTGYITRGQQSGSGSN